MQGSREDAAGVGRLLDDTLQQLCSTFPRLTDEIVVRDEAETVGRRLQALATLGIPYALIAGKRAAVTEIPEFELIDTRSGEKVFMTHAQLFDFVRHVIIPEITIEMHK